MFNPASGIDEGRPSGRPFHLCRNSFDASSASFMAMQIYANCPIAVFKKVPINPSAAILEGKLQCTQILLIFGTLNQRLRTIMTSGNDGVRIYYLK